MRFEWDRQKAALNIKRHDNISFDEASTVFDDPLAYIFDDKEHSQNESRELIIGHSLLGHLLIVSFTERAKDVIRIISARSATNAERKDYEENART
jgi:uncharacterized protein